VKLRSLLKVAHISNKNWQLRATSPNIRQFFEDAPAETTISLWAQYSSNKDCFFGLHSHIRDVITKKITNTTIPKSQKNNS
jgi:hypothetical protein